MKTTPALIAGQPLNPEPLNPEQQRLVALGRNWLRDSPETPTPLSAAFVGAFGPLPFVCPNCVGRLRARGCHVELFAKSNLFTPSPAPAPCNLCGAGC